MMRSIAGALALCLLAPVGGAVAHDGKANPVAPGASAKSVALKLGDDALVDQDRRTLKFKSEVLADRIIVMDFLYTSCSTTCPLNTALLTQVQDALGPRFGRDVHFVSITVDPVTDTPARLKTYARNHQLKPGWTLLTGPKATVDKVLEGLGAYTADFRDHPSMVLVGDARRGVWKRLFGLPEKDRIMTILDALLAARD
jgi:protein SCO1/2